MTPQATRISLHDDLTDMFNNLHNIPDEVRASALQSSELMLKNRELENSGLREKQDEVQAREAVETVTRRANMVTKFYEPDRKLALHKLKKLAAGEFLVVSMVDANHMRVACTYNRTHYDKEFLTRKFSYGKHHYLEIRRVG